MEKKIKKNNLIFVMVSPKLVKLLFYFINILIIINFWFPPISYAICKNFYILIKAFKERNYCEAKQFLFKKLEGMYN